MRLPSPIPRALSWLFEWPVARYSSDINQQLDVVLHRGRYKLITNGAIYSYSDLYTNYRLCFERLQWEIFPAKSCLVLGLGLASIPDMLVSRFKKEISFTAVELDETVTMLAQRYVLGPKNIKVDVFTADAASFLEWHQGRYDILCSDVFIGDHIPDDLQSVTALTAMRDLLQPGGLLLYNRLSRYKSDREQNLRFLHDVFLKVFPEGGYLDVEGNWMFVNRKDLFR